MHRSQFAFQVLIHQHQRSKRAMHVAVARSYDLLDLKLKTLTHSTHLSRTLTSIIDSVELGRN